jgi:hypothetical protein
MELASLLACFSPHLWKYTVKLQTFTQEVPTLDFSQDIGSAQNKLKKYNKLDTL